MASNKLTYVTSRDNPLLVRLRKLARHPGEYRKVGQLLLEGEHLCQAWATRGGAPALHALISESAWQQGAYLPLAEAAAATVVVADAAMAELSALDTPAPVAFVVPLPAPPAIRGDAPSVVLDRVQDAGNVGSILRSAAAFGFGQVIALEGTASLWSPKVLRAGMGAHFGLALIENRQAEVARCADAAADRHQLACRGEHRRRRARLAVRLGVRQRGRGRQRRGAGALRPGRAHSPARRRGVAQRRRGGRDLPLRIDARAGR